MSCNIRQYKSLDLGDGNNDLFLTAFCGGENGNCIQFTIGGKYCALSEIALLDLISVILKRIDCQDGYTATGEERGDILFST